MPYVTQAIQSILDGTLQPDKVVLYLCKVEFGDKEVPQDVLQFVQDNPIVEVRYYPRNLRSYMKLVPALHDFPEDIIVTIDDDIHYHPNMLRDLVAVHTRVPDAIIAHRVRKIRLGTPYNKWRKYKWYDFVFKKLRPTFSGLLTGVGGVLYPPHSLDETMLDPDTFTTIAPTTDDIWFWAAAVSKGTPIVPVPAGHNALREVGKPAELSLKTVNLEPGNDRNREAFDRVLERYPHIRAKLSAQ